MITSKDKGNANALLEEIRGAFITGSYLVDPDKANDIDVVASETAWILATGIPVAEKFQLAKVAGVILEKQENSSEDGERYADDENEMYELASHWRCNGVNVLVIRDFYLPAYKAASYALVASKPYYRDREARVKIHQHYKEQIRRMLSDAAEGDDIPW